MLAVSEQEFQTAQKFDISNSRGRNKGDRNLTTPEQTIIGTMANFDTAKNVSKELGVSPSHTHQLKHGRTGHKSPKQILKDSINTNKSKIHDAAVDKLLITLGLITKEEIESAHIKDKAVIASHLSRIIEKADPDLSKGKGSELTIKLMAPPSAEEEQYESITV